MTTIQLPKPISLTINPKINQFAEAFANKQTSPQKRKQVYLNTVAVLAVHSYLKWMDFNSDPANSDSWDYIAQTFHNVADLTIKNVGSIECRAITPDENQIEIPSIYQDNRLACVVVLIDKDEIHQVEEVKLLGAYLPEDQPLLPQVINVSDLKSCEDLIDYLEDIEFANEKLNYIPVDEELKTKIEQKLKKTFTEIVADYKAIFRQCEDLTSRIREAYNYNQELMGMTPNLATAVRGEEQDNALEEDEELYEIAEELMEELEDHLE